MKAVAPRRLATSTRKVNFPFRITTDDLDFLEKVARDAREGLPDAVGSRITNAAVHEAILEYVRRCIDSGKITPADLLGFE